MIQDVSKGMFDDTELIILLEAVRYAAVDAKPEQQKELSEIKTKIQSKLKGDNPHV